MKTMNDLILIVREDRTPVCVTRNEQKYIGQAMDIDSGSVPAVPWIARKFWNMECTILIIK